MFVDDQQSHKHSLNTLRVLDEFNDFKASIKNMLDLGSGNGLDLDYWANMTDNRVENPQPLNIKCVGLDTNPKQPYKNKNITLVKHDFNSSDRLPFSERKFDVIWCHNTLQFAHNPLTLLGAVSRQMAVNSMLYLCVPSTINVVHHKFKNYTFANQYATFTLTQLIYLLALNGFDCADAYFKKPAFEDYIEVIVYKNQDPVDYNLSWYELDALGLLSENMSGIINRIGYLTDNGLVTKWIDGEVFDYRHHS
jgi:SAM-dependent methyltransferase